MTQNHIDTMIQALVGRQVPELVSSIAGTVGVHTLSAQPAMAVGVRLHSVQSHARGVLRSFPTVGGVDVHL